MVTSTFVDALARGARAEGAVIHEGVTVDRLALRTASGSSVSRRTPVGSTADAVVVALGAWSTALLAGAAWTCRSAENGSRS